MRCGPCQWSRFQGAPCSGPPPSITTTECYRSAFVKTIWFNDRETQNGSIDPRRPSWGCKEAATAGNSRQGRRPLEDDQHGHSENATVGHCDSQKILLRQVRQDSLPGEGADKSRGPGIELAIDFCLTVMALKGGQDVGEGGTRVVADRG